MTDPGLILKYSTHKNLASMSAEGGDINTAMEHYLQAVMLDTTDVTLWYRIGSLAIKLGRLPLARHAFTSGLVCNENHWPCLDAAITVLFALLNYESCLYWIAKALEKESGYTKGLVFRNKIYKDCPHLKRDTEHLFRNCSFSINSVRIRKREAKQYIDYAKELQAEYEKLCVRKPPPDVPLTPPLESLRWLELGKSLVSTYQHLSSCDESVESSTNTLELSEDSADSLLTPEDLSAPSAMASSSSVTIAGSILDDIIIASTSWKIPEEFEIPESVCQALDISMDDDVKTKRGPKRKRQAIELTLESLTKRRSTRVRTSTHKSKQK
uniref:Uncharacterized LOC104265872 n=1 Tax=Ciona intestinalis TaxID=7719 RepID=H2XKD3_CIOIN